MSAGDKAVGPTLTVRVMIGIYRYLPLFLYASLWLGYRLLPFLKPLIGKRLGMSPPAGDGAPVVWFHGSSVGEVSSIGPVVAEMRRRIAGCRIVVTTMTVTGRKRAARELEGVEALVVPLDFFPTVRRFVTSLRPAVLIIGETELWPNLVIETRKQGASVILVNGRISNKSFPKYRMVKPLVEYLLENFDLLLMRAETDAERIIAMGAAPDKVRVVGNTKVDILPRPLGVDTRMRVRDRLGIAPSRLVICLGSARAGETEILLDAVGSAFETSRPLVIIAPRHINNTPQIEEICRQRGLPAATISKEQPDGRAGLDTEVIIMGCMGRLLEIYAISDIAVVGGSFRPFGGHNPLEPASQGTVAVVGPHIHNIADDIAYLRSQGVAVVTDETGLPGVLRDLAANGERRKEISGRAVEVVRNRRGVAGQCVDLMAERDLLP